MSLPGLCAGLGVASYLPGTVSAQGRVQVIYAFKLRRCIVMIGTCIGQCRQSLGAQQCCKKTGHRYLRRPGSAADVRVDILLQSSITDVL